MSRAVLNRPILIFNFLNCGTRARSKCIFRPHSARAFCKKRESHITLNDFQKNSKFVYIHPSNWSVAKSRGFPMDTALLQNTGFFQA